MLPVYPILAVPAVTAIVAGRIYQDQASPDAVAPYLVWRRQADVPELVLSGSPPFDRDTIRVDVFAVDEAQRDALTTATRDALEARGHVLNIQSLGRDVSPPSLWRSTMDADVFHPR